MKLIIEQYDSQKATITESESGRKDVYIEGTYAQTIKNRNGRMYPKPILEAQINRYLEEEVKTGKAMGELNHPNCKIYDDFQVLTDTGWTEFVDLSINDTVLSMNSNNELVLDEVVDITNQPYEGDAYEFKGRNIDTTVTPNHRFYLKNRYGKVVVATAEDIYNSPTYYSKYRIIKNIEGYNTTNNKKYITIPALNVDNPTKYKQPVNTPLIIDSSLFVKFLGFWLAEGSISKYSVVVSQNEGKVLDKVKSLYDEIGFSYTESSEKRRDNIHVTLRFADARLTSYLSKLGKVDTKFIPDEIKQLPAPQLRELVEWFGLGDGRKVINGSDYKKGKLLNIFTISKVLIEDLQECVIKSGLSGNISKVEPKDDYIFAEHLIKAENKSTLYVLNISHVDGIYLDQRHKFTINKIKTKNGAYCITTKNGNFYSRDNDKVHLTGNSLSVNPKEVCMKVEDLKWTSDTDVWGRAKLTNTPNGNLVRNLVVDDGITLGVSTRGVGSVKTMESVDIIQNDFFLKCWDVVTDPSAPDAFVNGIMENKEWIFVDGILVEQEIESLQKEINEAVVKTSFDPKRRDEIFSNIMARIH